MGNETQRTEGRRRLEIAFQAACTFSVVGFLAFGLACLTTDSMADDFERFGLARFRTLVGWVEVLGSLGLVVGLRYRGLLLASSGGLSLLMVAGLLARVRAGDDLLLMLPALLFLALNAFVFDHALRRQLPDGPPRA